MNGVIARGLLVSGLAGLGAYCLRAGAIMNIYNPAGPVLIGAGAFLTSAALIGFVVWIWRR
jgi:hypothetical protein